MASRVRKTWNGRAVAKLVHAKAGEGNTAAADVLLDGALDRVPRDTNELAETGTVSAENGGRAAAVAFGTDYAAVQHEDLTLEHPGGGEAKFLENAAHAEQGPMLRAAAEPLRRMLGG
ncbi:hypothetical protein [Glycomyces sp. YM15]|uniref:hypothetical protein n=1 Tax=Glycomyces sp. YM15 TaxID=2800446 RepID=UPI0019642DC5|nr:hypothetical protein [Glycomyces sp. YM15]